MDGFTWRLGRQFMAEGVMPNLARLVENGCHGNLTSVMPFETAPAWSAFQTGCRPGKTGVFGFHSFDRRQGKVRLNSFTQIEVPSIWELADRAGKKVVSLNMPMSSPPPQVNGVIIPGLLCLDFSEQTVHPPDAYKKYIKACKGYRIVNMDRVESLQEFVENQIEVERKRGEVALRLLADVDWDIFSVQMQSTDHLQHELWWALDPEAHGYCPNSRPLVLGLYQCCDEVLGKIVEAVGPDVLTLVVSDHGFCVQKHCICVNTWLREKGYLALNPPETQKEPVSDWVNFKSHLKAKAWPLKKLAVLYGLLKRSARQLRKATPTPLHCEKDLGHLRTLIDYSQTRAFTLGTLGGMLYILGAPAERKQLTEKITRELLDEFGPQSSQPLIAAISGGQAYYGSGPGEDTMPDLVLELASGVHNVIDPTTDRVVLSNYFTSRYYRDKAHGTHERDGIIVAQGPNICAGKAISADIVDVVPTVLAHLGMALPRHLDGTVIIDAFIEPPEAHHEDVTFEKTKASAYSDEEQEQVEKHLTDLGYL